MNRLGRFPGLRLRSAIAASHAIPRRRAPVSVVPSMPHAVRGILVAVFLAVCLALALFVPGAVSRTQIHVDESSPANLLAPTDITYVDSEATAELRRQAAAAVAIQYASSEQPQLQANTLLTALVNAAAGMQYQGKGAGARDLQAATLVHVSQGEITSALAHQLLTLSPRQLAHVQQLCLDALRLAQRSPLTAMQVPELGKSPSFPATESPGPVRVVAAHLYAVFLRPNRLPDDAATTAARRAAAAAISPVRAVFHKGDTIVRLGDVVSPSAYAALKAAGITDLNPGWRDLAADFLISAVIAGLLHGYLISVKSTILVRPRRLLLLDTVFLTTTVAASFVLQGHGLLPYVFPAATMSMLLTTLLSSELSIVAAVLWAVVAGWYMGGSFEIATYYLVTGLAGGLLVRDVRRSGEFFVAALWTAMIGLVTIFSFKLLNHGYDWLGLGTYTASVLVGAGLSAALTLGSLSALGRVFGVTTGINLLEISHPNHPLLRRLMQEAPGTFHHSMMIGTLAERAAEQIGADALLVRIVAYFHDIGKLYNPVAFAENQSGIGNVHERLEPRQSAELILQHVYEGVRLAREHHLPEVLEEGIWQHHGTTLVSFFYHQAVAIEGKDNVRIEDFRYPGPKPQTREMAILMLADVVEAAVRASPGVDSDQIRAIIHRLAQERLQDGQFDECNLTLRDLAVIEESFATVLQGLSHPRIQYPAPVQAVSGG